MLAGLVALRLLVGGGQALLSERPVDEDLLPDDGAGEHVVPAVAAAEVGRDEAKLCVGGRALKPEAAFADELEDGGPAVELEGPQLRQRGPDQVDEVRPVVFPVKSPESVEVSRVVGLRLPVTEVRIGHDELEAPGAAGAVDGLMS